MCCAMILRREALLKWKSKLGVSATPRALITALFKANETPCVEAACGVLGKEPDGMHYYTLSIIIIIIIIIY